MSVRSPALQRPRDDALLGAAIAGAAAAAGALSAIDPQLTLGALALAAVSLAVALRPGIAVYVVVGLVYLNLPATAVKE